MKTKFVLLFLLSFSVITGFSQKTDKQKITFDYTRMPSSPLAGDIQNYSSEVVLGYEEAINREYEAVLFGYPQELKIAEDNYSAKVQRYEEELKKWDEKSTASKLVNKNVLKEDKPREPAPFVAPLEPRIEDMGTYQKIFSKKMLTKSYLKLDGFTNTPDNAVKITATLFGFEDTGFEQKYNRITRTDKKTKKETTTTSYWYLIDYKHPINIKIEMPDGEVVVDEVFEIFNEYTGHKTKSQKTSHINKPAVLEKLQNEIVTENMKIINEYLNENFGYSKVSREAIIYRIESKKLNYDDYQEAYESAISGYNLLFSDYGSGMEKLNRSIEIWEKAITESEPSNKKARINSKVTTVTRFNLAEAYIWVNNYTKAEEQLNKIVALKPSKKEKKRIDEYRLFIKEQKIKWEVNQ